MLSVDYKLKAGLLSRDFDLVSREADILKNLLRTAVVHVEGEDLGKYYGDLFDLTVSKMRAIEPIATRKEFVATAISMLGGEFASLRDGSRLVSVSGSNGEHEVQSILDDAVRQFACSGVALPVESETTQYEFCRLQGGDVGVLRDGSVFVRRSSAVAIALQQVGSIWFDGSKLVKQSSMEPQGRSVKPWCNGNPPHSRADDLLTSLSSICNALSYIPEVGAVFGFASGTLSVMSALFGKSSKPSVESALGAVTRIVKNELKYDEVRRQLANVETWAGILSNLHAGLEAAGDAPENFIDTDYMPALNIQANSSASGNVLNSLTQLKSLWQSTSWEEMDLLEDILKGLALTLGYVLMVRRDRVLLCARMVASKDAKWHENYTQSLVNAYYEQYRRAVFGDEFVNPDWLKGRIEDWKTKRRFGRTPEDHYYDHGSDYGIAYTHWYEYGGERYVVEDHGRRDSSGRLPGVVSEIKTDGVFSDGLLRNAKDCAVLHQQGIDAEIRENLVPLTARCKEMIEAFESFKI